MRPRSVISLIIAAVFVLGGIITCAIASAKAASDGVMLFPEADSSGNLVYSTELNSVSKITVDVDDADVTVIGGADKSLIEVVNFNANYYKLTESNGSLNFAQVDDFMSMFKFWENGFSFKGMRYILRFGDDAAGDKRVIIHLSDNDDIRLVNLSTSTGTIHLEKCAFAADYTLKAENSRTELYGVTEASSISLYGSSADIIVENCSAGKLAVNGKSMNTSLRSVALTEGSIKTTDGPVKLEDCTADTLNVSTASGEIVLSPCKYTEGSVTTENGKVTLAFEDTDSISANVSTVNGKISVNGSFTDSFALNTPSPKYRINVTTGGGDVYITHP